MLFDFSLVVILGFIGGVIARKLKQPTVIGYLSAGFITTLFFPQILRNHDAIDAIAQIGVALLLFTLGIELNFKRLNRVIKIAVVGGVAQIIATSIIYRLVFPLFGFTGYESLFLAACFSLSSTAVVVKLLSEKRLTDSLPGEIMIAWLLIQDLAVVPLLVLLPFFKSGITAASIAALAIPVGVSSLFIAGILTVGKQAVKEFIRRTSFLNSQELLLLATISLCLVISIITEAAGLSFALGAFLAGVLVAETTENHALFAEIRPLRDLFSIVFFVSLPLLVSPTSVLSLLGTAFLLSILVVVVKFIVISIITLYFGYHSKVSFIVGIGLIQVGEFAFVLVREGLRRELISDTFYSLVLMVTLFTILLTPFVFNKSVRLYIYLQKFTKSSFPGIYPYLFARGTHEDAVDTSVQFENHAIICGYGRMGRYIGRALLLSDIPFVVIEYNRFVVNDLVNEKIPVLYGDPTDKDILIHANVQKAKTVIVAVPDLSTQLSIIMHTKKLNPDAIVITRVHFEQDQKISKSVGATSVVHPEFAASLLAVEKVLSLYSVDNETIKGKVTRLKIEHGME